MSVRIDSTRIDCFVIRPPEKLSRRQLQRFLVRELRKRGRLRRGDRLETSRVQNDPGAVAVDVHKRAQRGAGMITVCWKFPPLKISEEVRRDG